MKSNFRIHVPLEAFEKADDPDGNTMRIGGLVSTDRLDKEGERVVQEGLDFHPFLNEGWYNDNHSKETTGVVGYPSDAFFVQKGEQLPSGKKSPSNGWWAEGYLLNTEKGRSLWGLTQALRESPRKLGFSIEGKVRQRDPRDKNRVTKGVVKNVAVTHCPINTDTEMEALTKALTSGSAITDPGVSPGEGFPLRKESLEGSPDHPDKKKRKQPPYSQEGSSLNAWEDGAKEEQDPEDTENLAGGAGDDPNDGGWAGQNPHTTPIKDPSDALPPGKRALAKADEIERDFDLVEMSEIDLVRSWAPIFDRYDREKKPDRLTKAEARIMVAAAIPNLSPEEVDAFINELE